MNGYPKSQISLSFFFFWPPHPPKEEGVETDTKPKGFLHNDFGIPSKLYTWEFPLWLSG